MLLARASTATVSLECFAAIAAKLPVVMPLILGCLSIVVVISWAAAGGKLHIPGYAGLAFLTFAIAFLLGRVTGARGITGTTAGVFVTFAFFLLVAAGVGCILALFFYRDSPEA